MRSSLLAATLAPLASAITLDVTSTQSIKDAASTAAWGLASYYMGNETGQTPGLLPGPYYWWETGAMFGALINYWYYTGDSTYNDIVSQGLVFQAATPYNDFMPTNQTRDEGNDDQVFWGFSAMEAAEYGFPDPPSDQPQWLELAQGVFNSQAARWMTDSCNGGLRWQIFAFNNGYGYKNAPANAGFANLAARLYRYTGNETYAQWTNDAWGWMTGVGMIDETTGAVFDGTNVGNNCTSINHVQWTYTAGMVINICATMYNATGDGVWSDRLNTVWAGTAGFFDSNKIMTEPACEPQADCDTDMLSFKAYLSRWMAASAKLVPTFWDTVQPYLVASAQAAAAQCDGTGLDGNTQACGFSWPNGATWDGSTGVGQQMAALEVIQSLLTPGARDPVTAASGGTSKGNPSAGSTGDTNPNPAVPQKPITTVGRAGAVIVTALIVIAMVGGAWWLCR